MTHDEIVAWMLSASRKDRARVRSAWKASERSFREHNPDASYDQYVKAGRTAAEVEIVLIEWGIVKRSDKNG